MPKKRVVTKAEAKRLLAAIEDPKLKEIVGFMLKTGLRADATFGQAGAALAAQRRRTSHTCPVCSKRFSGIAKAVYCSNACRQKAKYQRKR